MEAFANAVGLRVIRFGLGVFDVIHRQEQFVIVLLDSAAVLRAPVGQYTQHRHSIVFFALHHNRMPLSELLLGLIAAHPPLPSWPESIYPDHQKTHTAPRKTDVSKPRRIYRRSYLIAPAANWHCAARHGSGHNA